MNEGENLNVAANAEQGAGGVSNPPASNEQQATIDGQAQALFEMLAGKFDERFNELTKPFLGQLEGLKKVQGEIDRSQNTFAEQLAQFNKIKAANAGMSDEQVLAKMQEDAKGDQRLTSIETTLNNLMSLVQSGGLPNQNQTVASVFEKFGLDVKDPRVAPELAKTYKSQQEMEVAALKKFHEIQTSPQPNAAQLAALKGKDSQRRNNTRDISNINDSDTLYNLAQEEMVAGK